MSSAPMDAIPVVFTDDEWHEIIDVLAAASRADLAQSIADQVVEAHL